MQYRQGTVEAKAAGQTVVDINPRSMQNIYPLRLVGLFFHNRTTSSIPGLLGHLTSDQLNFNKLQDWPRLLRQSYLGPFGVNKGFRHFKAVSLSSTEVRKST